MAEILRVIRIREEQRENISVEDALLNRVRTDTFFCPECDGKITLVKQSVNNMVAHGEHGRGQLDVFCSLKDSRLKRSKAKVL